MSREQKMKWAAQSGLVAVVNGKVDAYYAPPASIEKFADLLIEECARLVEAGTGKSVQIETLKILKTDRARIATALRSLK